MLIVSASERSEQTYRSVYRDFAIYVLYLKIEWYFPGGERSIRVQATARASINERSKVT